MPTANQASAEPAQPHGTPVQPGSAPATPADGPPANGTPANGAPPSGGPANIGLPSEGPANGTPADAGRPAEPSWGTVLATTVRLWAQRRLSKARWRVALGLALAAIVFLAGAVTIALIKGTGGQQGTGQGGSQASGPGAGALATVATARRQAAAWVAQQVNADAVVACDPAMCGALQTAGVPAGRLLVLRPGQGDPLGSDVLLATPAVRGEFGNQLASVYAPVVLAAFGSGTARIEVRVVAAEGAATYLAALAADVAARKQAAAQMLHNSHIQASPAVRSRLAAGQVDPRLLVTLVTLAALHPVDIISFGGSPASGVSAGAPLRFAEITGAAPAHGHRPASIQTLRAFFRAQHTPYRPSTISTARFGSRTALRVEYPAPTPLSLLGSHG